MSSCSWGTGIPPWAWISAGDTARSAAPHRERGEERREDLLALATSVDRSSERIDGRRQILQDPSPLPRPIGSLTHGP
jgi:hypothetical protein